MKYIPHIYVSILVLISFVYRMTKTWWAFLRNLRGYFSSEKNSFPSYFNIQFAYIK